MKISPTLSVYLARAYVARLLFFIAALLAVLYVFDCLEILRRVSKRSDAPVGLAFEIALMKLPKEGEILLPFAALFSAIFTFWNLNRRQELVVARAAGFSFWQFLAPVVGVAMAAGVLHTTILNPIGAAFVGQYERMERQYLYGHRGAEIALFREGLWLKQDSGDGGYVILHAPKIDKAEWTLRQPMALFFTGEDQFVRRVDADSARLESDRWAFENAHIRSPSGLKDAAAFDLPTSLTRQDVEDSFSAPETLSFWRLPAHIQTLEETGFDSSRLRVRFQSLLAQPLFYAAMILLAAAVSLRPPRSQKAFMLAAVGAFIGFVVFFLSSFLEALGATDQLPPALAAWASPLAAAMLGLGVLINLEDG